MIMTLCQGFIDIHYAPTADSDSMKTTEFTQQATQLIQAGQSLKGLSQY